MAVVSRPTCEAGRCVRGVYVPSSGNPEAEVVIVGEAPGAMEADYGKPFIGLSGQLLRKLCREVGLDPSTCYVTNSCKGYAEGNPDGKELKVCREHCLRPEIEAHPRRLLIGLGNAAGFSLGVLRGVEGITANRGEVRDSHYNNPDGTPIKCILSFHPAAILRGSGEDAERLLRLDLQTAVEYLESGEVASRLPEVAALDGDYGDVLRDSEKSGWLALDIECDVPATSRYRSRPIMDPYHSLHSGGKIVGIAICGGEKRATFVRGDEECLKLLEEVQAVKARHDPRAFRIVGHNAKFDVKWLHAHYGVPLDLFTWDTSLAYGLLAEEGVAKDGSASFARSGLKVLAQARLGWSSYGDEIEQLLGEGTLMSGMNPDTVRVYACYDALATWMLAQLFFGELGGQKLHKTMDKLMMPMHLAFSAIERQPLYVDIALLKKIRAPIVETIAKREEALRQMTGDPEFNPGSDLQVSEFLFGRKGKTKRCFTCAGKGELSQRKMIQLGSPARACPTCLGTGKEQMPDLPGLGAKPTILTEKEKRPSVSEEALTLVLEDEKPNSAVSNAIALLLEHSEWDKVLTAFVDQLLALVTKEGTRWAVRPEVKLGQATTGRTASAMPNIQNQPQWLRGVFYAGPGRLFLDFDMRQAEVRVWAMYSECPNLRKMFASRSCSKCGKEQPGVRVCPACGVENIPADVYATAARLGFPKREITSELRNQVKVVFLGQMYGLGAAGFAKRLGVDIEEAETLLTRIKALSPKGHRWIAEMEDVAQRPPYEVTSMYGRIRRLKGYMTSEEPRIRAEGLRKVANSLIQGFSSDMVILSAIRAWEGLRESEVDCFPQAFVHDSVLYSCAVGEVLRARDIIKEAMTVSPVPEVMLDVECKVGPRWAPTENIWAHLRGEDGK